MSSSWSLADLPNPYTPMAFLPPEMAYQMSIASYVLVGSLSVLIWDIVTNLHAEIRMITHYLITPSLVVYFVSRITALGYLLGLAILQTSPVGHCAIIMKIEVFYPIFISSTAMLFFFRVRAMYSGNDYVVGFFFVMWLCVVASSITPIFGVSGGSIGNTNYCMISRQQPYVVATAIVSFVNDTFVFLATSWKLLKHSHAEKSIKNGIRVMVLGRYLPAFSRAVLQDGQAYYLSIITVNISTITLFLLPNISPVYRSFCGIPNIVLMNVMACLVYRKIRFGDYKECATCAAISAASHHDRSIFATAFIFGKVPRRRVPDVVQPNENNMEQEKLSQIPNGEHQAPIAIGGHGRLHTHTV